MLYYLKDLVIYRMECAKLADHSFFCKMAYDTNAEFKNYGLNSLLSKVRGRPRATHGTASHRVAGPLHRALSEDWVMISRLCMMRWQINHFVIWSMVRLIW